ncbi:MAG TPA: ABC transporter permease [Pararobbsia sp.]|nr:ABC transporter permease [Pararobbsia sp.]
MSARPTAVGINKVVVLASLWVVVALGLVIAAPGIVKPEMVTSVLQFSTLLALVSLGQAMVVLCGGAGIDLSVGGIVSLACVLTMLLAKAGLPAVLIPVICPVIGLVLGGINGWLVTRLRLLPLIATLGTFYVYSGLALSLTDGTAQAGVPAWLIPWGRESLAGIPYGFLTTVIPAFLVVAVLLSQTSWGRWIYATGFNERAAHLVGIRVERIRLLAYCGSGLLAGIAALISLAWLGSGRPNIGQNLELESLTAVLLGGIGIFGGTGGVGGVLAAVLLLVTLQAGLQFVNVSSVWQVGAVGVLLIFVLLVDRVPQRLRILSGIGLRRRNGSASTGARI